MKIKRLIVGDLETNCYLLISENKLIIIDPGGSVEKILKEIKEIKAKPKYIINTHCHPDHISANEGVKKETGAEILTPKAGDEIKIGVGDSPSVLKVIHTPGHTKDSICLLGKNFIFTGDTLFKNGYGRTDLPGGSQKELEESLEKLSKLLRPGSMNLYFISRLASLRGARRMTVYPGHGEIFQY